MQETDVLNYDEPPQLDLLYISLAASDYDDNTEFTTDDYEGDGDDNDIDQINSEGEYDTDVNTEH